ncbi:MAG: hypothetical protein WCA56_03685 [Xanthobacteraceae bacterium]
MKATVQLNPTTVKQQVSKGGLFRAAKTVDVTQYDVAVFVEFTEEERAILTEYNLWETPAWMVPAGFSQAAETLREIGEDMPTEYPCTIAALAHSRGAHRQFSSSAEAIDFQNEVKTKFLPGVKELLAKHQGPVSNAETLEF